MEIKYLSDIAEMQCPKGHFLSKIFQIGFKVPDFVIKHSVYCSECHRDYWEDECINKVYKKDIDIHKKREY